MKTLNGTETTEIRPRQATFLASLKLRVYNELQNVLQNWTANFLNRPEFDFTLLD